MMQNNQKILNWLKSEKEKDDRFIKLSKEKYISEIKKLKKSDLFIKQPKLSLWQRIRMMIFGY